MKRQLALKLVSKMQTNVWNLTDEQAEIILDFLESDKKRSEQFYCEKYYNAYKICSKQCKGCEIINKQYAKQ